MFDVRTLIRRYFASPALAAAVLGGLASVIVASVVAYLYLENDIHRLPLDPKIPFQINVPPKAPDYAKRDAWFLNPAKDGYTADPRKVDVFFVHGTSFNGGPNWLGAVDDARAAQEVTSVQLPNYAGPFSVFGDIYAPRYRQASMFSQLGSGEDSREARQFPYRDIEAAFDAFLRTRRDGRGFAIVGVEQGGILAERLLATRIGSDPELRSQLVAAYLIETLVPADAEGVAYLGAPPCQDRAQPGCVIAYTSVDSVSPDKFFRLFHRGVYWKSDDTLASIEGRPALCVNPLIGAQTEVAAEAELSRGATNATNLEWGVQPALIPHKVSARCYGGFLVVGKPPSDSFNYAGTWEERRKVRHYNLFYGDLADDFQQRLLAFRRQAETDKDNDGD